MVVSPDQITPETIQILYWLVPTTAMIFALPRIARFGVFVVGRLLKVGQ